MRILIFVSTFLQTGFSLEDTSVQLPNGQILGREGTTSEKKTFLAFEGIPYAAPPLGELRFKSPKAAENWEGVLNTTQLDVCCYQQGMSQKMYDQRQSEDCLFLNVYTPKLSNENELLAVMVYIHGGGFWRGCSIDYQPDLFINNDVILVTINYRLGVFGSLSTQDEVISGNNGLKDQSLALHWVHDNINLFGGDPEKVTIFGESAGAASCAYHLLNQNSKGLFSRVILESGTFLSQGMFQRNSRQVAFGIGAVLNSTFETNNDSSALHEFLSNIEAEVLNKAAEEYKRSVYKTWNKIASHSGLFAPTIEAENPGAFLTEKMYGLLEAGNILPVTTMMGFTSEESVWGKNDPEKIRSILALIDKHLEYLVPNDMQITDSDRLAKMGLQIRNMYTKGEAFADHVGAGIRYSTDNGQTRPMRKHAELFSKIATTYFYQFSYDGEIGGVDAPDFGDGAGTVGHTEELNYLFCSGESCTSDNYPETDLLTRQRLIKLWTNFAKYENPTPEPYDLLQNVTWPKHSSEDGNFFYLDIGENLEVRTRPKQEIYEKWVSLYDGIGYDDFDSY